ncbi:hypothetical protein JOL79_12400 [Microbispora sp. RL4-1S]|uniref:Uncharacterized protein n=1 Tax=Microbispora oryzae TaxID=2806554 RepID=A0A940WFK5_9ACTN|nr:hypothetical protein [Microbispora oryzae]MBP2704615.1 hypothetical protein [Microbispora oryzae]
MTHHSHVRWADGTIRRTYVRHHTARPPLPLGCRWCGHPPYAHEADSVPSRPRHVYEPPTTVQMRRRGEVRRRLGLTGRFPVPEPARCVRPPMSPMLPIEAAAARAVRAVRAAGRPPAPPPGRREPYSAQSVREAA